MKKCKFVSTFVALAFLATSVMAAPAVSVIDDTFTADAKTLGAIAGVNNVDAIINSVFTAEGISAEAKEIESAAATKAFAAIVEKLGYKDQGSKIAAAYLAALAKNKGTAIGQSGVEGVLAAANASKNNRTGESDDVTDAVLVNSLTKGLKDGVLPGVANLGGKPVTILNENKQVDAVTAENSDYKSLGVTEAKAKEVTAKAAKKAAANVRAKVADIVKIAGVYSNDVEVLNTLADNLESGKIDLLAFNDLVMNAHNRAKDKSQLYIGGLNFGLLAKKDSLRYEATKTYLAGTQLLADLEAGKITAEEATVALIAEAMVHELVEGNPADHVQYVAELNTVLDADMQGISANVGAVQAAFFADLAISDAYDQMAKALGLKTYKEMLKVLQENQDMVIGITHADYVSSPTFMRTVDMLKVHPLFAGKIVVGEKAQSADNFKDTLVSKVSENGKVLIVLSEAQSKDADKYTDAENKIMVAFNVAVSTEDDANSFSSVLLTLVQKMDTDFAKTYDVKKELAEVIKSVSAFLTSKAAELKTKLALAWAA